MLHKFFNFEKPNAQHVIIRTFEFVKTTYLFHTPHFALKINHGIQEKKKKKLNTDQHTTIPISCTMI